MAKIAFRLYGRDGAGDDPGPLAKKGPIDKRLGLDEHQIALLWSAIEKPPARSREPLPTEDYVLGERTMTESFDAER